MKTFLDRYWAKVRIADGCWEWQGAKQQGSRGGYGMIKGAGRRNLKAGVYPLTTYTPKGPLLVEWVDSRQPSGAWERVGDLQPECCRCYSVGFVVRDDKDLLALAPNVADADGEPQATGVVVIPRVAVVSVTPLSPLSCGRGAASRPKRQRP